MWLLWDWMGIGHWEFHGMVLWVMQWDSMDLHWVLRMGNSQAWLLCEWMGIAHWGFHGIVFWGSALGLHGLALGLLIGNAMEVFYG